MEVVLLAAILLTWIIYHKFSSEANHFVTFALSTPKFILLLFTALSGKSCTFERSNKLANERSEQGPEDQSEAGKLSHHSQHSLSYLISFCLLSWLLNVKKQSYKVRVIILDFKTVFNFYLIFSKIFWIYKKCLIYEKGSHYQLQNKYWHFIKSGIILNQLCSRNICHLSHH